MTQTDLRHPGTLSSGFRVSHDRSVNWTDRIAFHCAVDSIISQPGPQNPLRVQSHHFWAIRYVSFFTDVVSIHKLAKLK
jgi:hypothetical protein